MSNESLPTEAIESTQDEGGIDFLSLLAAIGEEKRFIARFAGVILGLAILYAYTTTPVFKAKTVVYPPQNPGANSMAIMAATMVAPSAGLGGLAASLKGQEELYIALLSSESVLDEVVRRLDLVTYYKAKKAYRARKKLAGATHVISMKKSGLISIEVEDKDPAMAAKMANAHVDALNKLFDRLAITSAQQRRKYLEKQIAKTQEELDNADSSFRSLSGKGGFSVTDTLAESKINASAVLRAQIAAKEVQLSAVAQFTTDQNPDTRRVMSELAALRAQLAKFESGGQQLDEMKPEGKEALLALRNLKVQQTLMELLVKQYEFARIEETKESALVQQVDIATPPEQKFKPKRMKILFFALIGGIVFGVLIALVRRALRNNAADASRQESFSRLKAAWRWR